MTETPPVDRLVRALEATGEIVDAIKNDQWSNRTPCAEWNVRTVLNHLVIGNRMFAGIVRGEPLPSPEELGRLRTVDQLGDDPAAAYRDSATALVTAFRQPGVFERVVQVPAGTVPGIVALHLRITEALVHGWDLAQGTGQPARLPDDLAEEELAFARGRSAPDVPRTGHPFGPVQSIADDAPAIDRLVAYLGRPVRSGVAESSDC